MDPKTEDHEYDFVVWFDVMNALFDCRHTIQDICDILESSVGREQFSKILHLGIKSNFEKTNDFSLICKIQQSIKQDLHLRCHKNENTHKKQNKEKYHIVTTDNSKNVTNILQEPKANNKSRLLFVNSHCKVFGIQSLMCNIFQYLNFESLLHCHLVNKQWFYDSYHPSSVYHLCMNDLQHISQMKRVNLSRFKNISSLWIESWIDSKASKNLHRFGWNKFKNISKFRVGTAQVGSMATFENVVCDIIRNNRLSMKKLAVQRNPSFKNLNNSHWDNIVKFIQATTFGQLEKLDLKSVNMFGTFLDINSIKNNSNNSSNNNNNTINSNNIIINSNGSNKENKEENDIACDISIDYSGNYFSNLESICIENSHLSVSFWQWLASDGCNLSNLKSLTLSRIDIGTSIKTSDNLKKITRDYTPLIAKKLTRLEHFCFEDLVFNDIAAPMTSIMLSLVYHLGNSCKNGNNSVKTLNLLVNPVSVNQWIKLDKKYGFKFGKSKKKRSRMEKCKYNYDINSIYGNFNQLEHACVSLLSDSRPRVTLAEPSKTLEFILCFITCDHNKDKTRSNCNVINSLEATEVEINMNCSSNSSNSKNNNKKCKSMSKDKIANKNKNKNICNVKQLRLVGWEESNISLASVCSVLKKIRFSNLQRLMLNRNEKYDIVLKRDDLKKQIDCMNLINGLIKSVSNNKNCNDYNYSMSLRIETKFESEYLDTGSSFGVARARWIKNIVSDDEMQQTAKLLNEWNDRGDIEVNMVFYCDRDWYKMEHFEFPEKAAGQILLNRINTYTGGSGNIGKCVSSLLNKNKFVGPYYGGTPDYIDNQFDVPNTSMTMIVRLEQYAVEEGDSCNNSQVCHMEKQFVFVVRVIPPSK